jgi:subtilisin family serine protease
MHHRLTLQARCPAHRAVFFVILAWIGALLLALSLLGVTYASPATIEELPTGLLIGIVPGTPLDEVAAYLQTQGLALGRVWPDLALVEARPPENAVFASAASAFSVVKAGQTALAKAPFVRYAAFDELVYAAASAEIGPVQEPPFEEPTPDDPMLPQQWAVDRIQAVKSWNISHGDPQVVVAVIDSGYSTVHPEFDPAVFRLNPAEAAGTPGIDDDGNGYVDDIRGWDWVGNDNTPNDEFGHGTHVQGVIVAHTNNSLGITGLGRNLRVLPLRILDSGGRGQISDLIDALDYAEDMDARIVNLSLVIPSDSDALREAIVAAYDAGVLVVTAAGNRADVIYWPAAYTQTLAVAATTIADRRAGYSSIKSGVDIAAPGDAITSTYLASGYAILSGTSMATPHVSALAGLLWSVRPDYSRQQVINAIRATSGDVNADTDPGPDEFIGAGRIDLYAALLAASQGITITRPDASTVIAHSGDAVNYSMRANTPAPASLPIEGAVVYYQIWTAGISTQTALTPLQRNVTVADGSAMLTFTAPDTPGDYVVRSQIGQTIVDLPLIVQIEPASLALTLSAASLVAGDGIALLTVEVRDEEGQLEKGNVPVDLATTLGHFGDGVTTKRVIVHNGVHATTFFGGVVAGVAHISAESGHLTEAQQLRIDPGPLTHLLGPDPVPSIVSQAATTIPLDFMVTDAFGNSAPDGTIVQVYTDSGVLTPPSVATVNGRASTTLYIPDGQEMAVMIWATVPGTRLQTRIDIPVLQQRLWLPAVRQHAGD